MNSYLLNRLIKGGRYKKVMLERLTEPLHLNFLSLFVAIFGSYGTKVGWDLVTRQQYAFPLLWAARHAKELGFQRISAVEFGVAQGNGLLNMCELARRTTAFTGVEIDVYGFDTGAGMPAPIDYRDIPEFFQTGDFPMQDPNELRARLPGNAKLIIGDIAQTVKGFVENLSPDAPLGFVSIDVDYYSSTVPCLGILKGDVRKFLPMFPIYFDDLGIDAVNPWNGEALAINEFNAEQELRKIAPFTYLRAKRIFKNPQWIEAMYMAHFHDHPLRAADQSRGFAKSGLESW
jgi:hypothetical protein